MSTVAEQLVERGALMWDKKLPTWFIDIDLPSLSMMDACKCVGGQIAGKKVNLDALGWHRGSEEEIGYDPIGTPADRYGAVMKLLGIRGGEYGMDSVTFCTLHHVENQFPFLTLNRTEKDQIQNGEHVIIKYSDLQSEWVKQVLKRRAKI